MGSQDDCKREMKNEETKNEVSVDINSLVESVFEEEKVKKAMVFLPANMLFLKEEDIKKE